MASDIPAQNLTVSAWGVMYRYRLQDGGSDDVLLQYAYWTTRRQAREWIAKRRSTLTAGERMWSVPLSGRLYVQPERQP